MLLLASLTLSLGLRGQDIRNIKTCYSYPELQNIAKTAIRAAKCDTLLNICSLQLEVKDSINKEQEAQVKSLLSVIDKQEKLQEKADYDLKMKDKTISKLENKNRWIKVGWVSTVSAILVGIILTR